MISKVSPTNIRKSLNYTFFIDPDNHYYPLQCMLDLGSTNFMISPNGAKVFKIPVIKRTTGVKSKDVTAQEMFMEGRYTIPLGLSLGNYRSYDTVDHAFEEMETSGDYDCLTPAWYLEKHNAQGTTTSHLHFPHCGSHCYSHEKVHPEYSITYDR
jgi:hypothetical protein